MMFVLYANALQLISNCIITNNSIYVLMKFNSNF